MDPVLRTTGQGAVLTLRGGPETKAEANRRRHRVSFQGASTAFADEGGRLRHGPDHSGDEDRFILLGFSAKVRLLTVRHAYRGNDDLIISARRATRNERKQDGSFL